MEVIFFIISEGGLSPAREFSAEPRMGSSSRLYFPALCSRLLIEELSKRQGVNEEDNFLRSAQGILVNQEAQTCFRIWLVFIVLDSALVIFHTRQGTSYAAVDFIILATIWVVFICICLVILLWFFATSLAEI